MFYIKSDKSYVKKDFDDVFNDLFFAAFYRNSTFTKAEMLANIFTKCRNVNYDSSFEGMAAIDIDNNTIVMNKDLIVAHLSEAFPFVVFNIEKFPFLVGKAYYDEYAFDFETYLSLFACYLILHEVGHYLYSAPASYIKKEYKKVCASLGVPFSFVFFVNNVVEDSFIQRRLQLDYPIALYRDIFFLGTTIVQGPVAIKNFVADLDKGEPLSIKDKLFYLILRAYNLFDKDVQSVFNNNPLIEWTPEALAMFDRATTIIDKEMRANFTTDELVPVLFNILHEVVKKKKSELNNCCGDSPSLLDEDKLREVEFDEEDENDSGNPDSEKPEDEYGEEKDCGGETKSDSSADDSKKSSSDSGSSSDDESTEQKEEFDSSESSESTDGKMSEQKSSERSEGNSSENVSESSDKKDVSKNDAKGQAQAKESDGKSLEEVAQSLEDSFIEELDQASKELNVSIDETKDRSEDVSKRSSIQKCADKIDNDDITNALNGVKKTAQKNIKSLASADSYDKERSCFNNKAQSLFNSASQLFKRIYNFDTEDLSYLDNGELDENLITDFYTEKSVNIFKQHLDLVETKKIKVVFMLDDSGSMGGTRASNCRTIVPPLIHAFEESGIKCCFFMFGSSCAIVKDFNDPAYLIDNCYSGVLYQMDHTVVGGSTNITPALMALASRDYSDKDDTVYILFVLTDGCFDNEDTASSIFKYLRTEIGFNLFGITIDDPYGKERLIRDMYQGDSIGNDYIFNYQTDELITKLPYDIYNIIVDKFIKK